MTVPSGNGQTDQAHSLSVVAASPATSYTFDEFTDGGGSAIAADPNPNTTPPPESRCHRAPAGRFTSLGIRCLILDGTTITFTIWVYDDVRQFWVQFAPSVALNNVGVSATAPGENMAGAKVFVQLTANTGVTKFIWFFT